MQHEPGTSTSTGSEQGVEHKERTTCCIVGAGPCGTMLGLLLARKEVEVTMLEAHADFECEFRGDTLAWDRARHI